MDIQDKKDFEIEKRVYQIRKRGANWEDVSSKVSKEFDKEVATSACKDLYNTHIARAEVISRTLCDDRKAALKVKFDWDKRMEEKLIEIDKWVSKLMNQMGTIFDKAVEADDYNVQVKLVPTLLAVCREILSQISVIKKQQENIVVNQKNVVLNEMQVLQVVNKEFKRKEEETGYVIHPGTGEMIIKKRKKLILNSS